MSPQNRELALQSVRNQACQLSSDISQLQRKTRKVLVMDTKKIKTGVVFQKVTFNHGQIKVLMRCLRQAFIGNQTRVGIWESKMIPENWSRGFKVHVMTPRYKNWKIVLPRTGRKDLARGRRADNDQKSEVSSSFFAVVVFIIVTSCFLVTGPNATIASSESAIRPDWGAASRSSSSSVFDRQTKEECFALQCSSIQQ